MKDEKTLTFSEVQRLACPVVDRIEMVYRQRGCSLVWDNRTTSRLDAGWEYALDENKQGVKCGDLYLFAKNNNKPASMSVEAAPEEPAAVAPVEAAPEEPAAAQKESKGSKKKAK